MISYTKTFTRPNNTVAFHWQDPTFMAQNPESPSVYIAREYPGAMLQETTRIVSQTEVAVTMVFSSVAGISTDPVVAAYNAAADAYNAAKGIVVTESTETV